MAAPRSLRVTVRLPYTTYTSLTTPLTLTYLVRVFEAGYAFAGITAQPFLFLDQLEHLGAPFPSEGWG